MADVVLLGRQHPQLRVAVEEDVAAAVIEVDQPVGAAQFRHAQMRERQPLPVPAVVQNHVVNPQGIHPAAVEDVGMMPLDLDGGIEADDGFMGAADDSGHRRARSAEEVELELAEAHGHIRRKDRPVVFGQRRRWTEPNGGGRRRAFPLQLRAGVLREELRPLPQE